MNKTFSVLLLPILTFGLTSGAMAATIVQDSFGTTGDPTANLNGRTPDIGPDWTAYSGGSNVGWKTENGTALYGTSGTNSGFAGVLIGSNYFDDNPGIYELSADITFGHSDAGLLGLGFSEGVTTTPGEIQSSNGKVTEGEPWMFLRGDGRLNVRSDSNTDIFSSAAGTFSTSGTITLTMVLDTTPTNWTLEAYYNSTQLDLAGSGLAYTFSTNPTIIGAVGLSSSVRDHQVDNFTLVQIPEPSSFALVGIAALAAALVMRRRVR